MKNNHLEWQVDQALNSLDGIQRATANPFLYTRIKAAIDEQNGAWARFAGIFTRPAYALTIAGLFLTLNIYVAINRQHSQPAGVNHTEGEQAFAAELATVNYNLQDLNSSDK